MYYNVIYEVHASLCFDERRGMARIGDVKRLPGGVQ
jgi:hypothetical protein